MLFRSKTMPVDLAVARMPAAIPCLLNGADPIIALLFGEINIPVPNPTVAKAKTMKSLKLIVVQMKILPENS